MKVLAMVPDSPAHPPAEPQVTLKPSDERLRFGAFELISATGELFRRGSSGNLRPVKLQPQPAKALRYLAERAGHLVTRHELQEHLWGIDHFVDYEQGLNYCIRAVRRALDDDATHPIYLETVPRRGYRFVCSVTRKGPIGRTAAPLPDSQAGGLQPPAPPKRRRRAASVAIAVALISVALHWAIWAGWLEPSQPPKIAVLPFDNHTRSSAVGVLATSLTEELTAQLANSYASELGVVARTNSSLLAGQTLTAAQLGRELDADYLLTGGVQESPDGLRISLQLIQARNEIHIWAEIYDRGIDETEWDAWLETVASEIARRLELQQS